VLEERIIKSYSDFKRSIGVVRADDPVAGKYLHGKHSYTIKKTQESLKKTNSGRIEICNLNYEDTLINMMWYLTPDSVYCEINRFKNHEDYLSLTLGNMRKYQSLIDDLLKLEDSKLNSMINSISKDTIAF
jgi:hypothetical protein